MGKEKRFEVLYKESLGMTGQALILADKQTGVQYMFFMSGYGGGLTALLDKDGKPIVTEPVNPYK